MRQEYAPGRRQRRQPAEQFAMPGVSAEARMLDDRRAHRHVAAVNAKRGGAIFQFSTARAVGHIAA